MSPATRKTYFRLWGDAARVNGWDPKDDTQRKGVTRQCMAAIGAPETDSTSLLKHDETTALFCYLQFLAGAGADIEASARWLDCKTDFKAFNRAQQADWHERETYGSGPNKLDRDRFGGATSAKGEAFDAFDPSAIAKRHLTMKSRHVAKLKREGKPTAAAVQPAPRPAVRPERTVDVGTSENPF